MSAGHDVSAWATADEAKARRALENPAVQAFLNRPRRIDRSHDLPYLAGYSEDGSVIYIDRHLPEWLEVEWDGKKYGFSPDHYLELHEEAEKALIDALGWHYLQAHSVANRVEGRAVFGRGIIMAAYKKALNPYIKADAIEKLEKVPADLDMTPYYAPPVDKKLIARMRKAMGEEKKNKAEVNYSDDRGTPSRHCGADSDWAFNFCSMYGNHDCTAVEGYIDPKGGCDLWERADNA